MACKTTAEVTIIEGYPAKQNAPEQVDVRKDFETPALTLKIGELDPIRTLDPLFASNPASQRVAGWVYEGLTGYDATGTLIPRLAKSWTISPDSITYTFTLEGKAAFHSHPAIGAGVGRLLRAADVKQVFERMAHADVPPTAARLFNGSILGFEAYFTEQREVYEAEERRLTGVSGIVAKNDTTVVFTLTKPDRLFLNKLATPWASIYPVEAVTRVEGGLKYNPIGTGPWQFVQHRGDSVWVFEPNRKYRTPVATHQGAPARVEVQVSNSEIAMYRKLAMNDLHVIQQIGPLISKTVLNNEGNLNEAFQITYEIQKNTPRSRYELQYNPQQIQNFLPADLFAVMQLARIDALLQQATAGLYSFEPVNAPKEAGSPVRLRGQFPPEGTPAKRINIAFPNDLHARFIARALGNEMNRHAAIQLVQTPIITREMAVYLHHKVQYVPVAFSAPGEGDWLIIRAKHVLLKRKGVDGLQLNPWAWWFNINNAIVPIEEDTSP
jgi:hypothetical protein